MAPQAIAGATATIAGNYLGENLPGEAKFIIDLGIALDFLWGLVTGLILVFLLRPYWGIMYTDEIDVQEMIYQSLPIMLLYITVDSTKCITLNILRSIGRPGITVVGNVISCVCVMLPLGYILSLRMKLGLVGLWLSMSIAWLLATIVYLYILIKTDWQEQADHARDRNESASHKVTISLSRESQNSNEEEDDDDDDTLVYTFSPLPIEDQQVVLEKRWVKPIRHDEIA
jgi:MATE family multidrug resistance protein